MWHSHWTFPTYLPNIKFRYFLWETGTAGLTYGWMDRQIYRWTLHGLTLGNGVHNLSLCYDDYVPNMEGLCSVVAEIWMIKNVCHKTLKWVWPNFLPLSPTPGSDLGVWCYRIEGYAMLWLYFKYGWVSRQWLLRYECLTNFVVKTLKWVWPDFLPLSPIQGLTLKVWCYKTQIWLYSK